MPLLDQGGMHPRGSTPRSPCCFRLERQASRPGNVLETGGGNRGQTEAKRAAAKRDVPRRLAASRNQPQTPNPPYKQEVAGSSPAPPMAFGPPIFAEAAPSLVVPLPHRRRSRATLGCPASRAGRTL